MYLAPKLLREAMTVEQKIEQLKKMMESTGYSELLTSLKGYIHTIDSRILEGVTGRLTSDPSSLFQSRSKSSIIKLSVDRHSAPVI